MSYRNTLEAALESLYEIEDLVKGFPENGDIPEIELDLSLQKIRNLYELLLLFRKPVFSRTEPDHSPETAKSTETEPPVVPDKGPEPETPRVNTASEPPVAGPKPASSKPKTGSETRILSDRFKGRATLHETLHKTLTKDSGTLAQSKPVSNLMTAIGINDRFTFIRELFNNDTPAFESTINILNEATNFNDAYNYMIQNHDWDMDSDAVQLLLEIIRRKYITGRHE
jgi:hypothetical protein